LTRIETTPVKKYITLTNLSQPHTRPVVARYCQSFFCRLRGLMLTRSLAPDSGLLLVQSRENRTDASIHMLFMAMDLAVVWINNNLDVVDVCLAQRWRPVYFPKKPAGYVLETSIDRLADFNIGDKVRIDEAWMD
jgi:uncharacterized membrane protein (UPF0127 family)